MVARPDRFGDEVRALRIVAGLTQGELGQRSGISERTVSDLERGVRATAYPSTARRLAAALGVAPGELAAFLTSAQGHPRVDASSLTTTMPSDRNGRLLVPLTRLIGRESELGAVLGMVTDPGTRLVTLVGIGGIGKTRLAIEVASQAQLQFPGGTFFVGLSGTDDPAMVLPSIATAVGLAPTADALPPILERILSEGRALLVLDTLEHLVAAAPAIGALLEANPQLAVLATSRTPLHLRGEREFPVLPLRVRDEDRGSASSPAVALFLERAAAVSPEFDTTPSALEVVADICARVDGVPLAIELAAAAVKHMSLSELRIQLHHRLAPLGAGASDLPARQRTMRATHDWSYALLGASQMRLFRHLAAFRGGFGSDAAQAMLGPDEPLVSAEILMSLGVLVDSSLILVESTETQTRYRLLDVTREYAVERSVAAGEFDSLRRRHAEHFLARAESAEPALRGRDQGHWYALLLEDEGNFRAALSWALEVGEGALALRLAGALWMFWRWAALFAEGRVWLEAALAAGTNCSLEVRSQGIWGAGWLAFHAGDYARMDELGRELLGSLVGRDDAIPLRNALTLIGSAALAEGRTDDAIAAYRDALAVSSRLGSSWHVATSQLNLGTALLQAGRAPAAGELFGDARGSYEQLGDRHFTSRVLIQLGHVALLSGSAAAACAPIERAMEISAELGDGWAISEGLEAVATLRSDGDPRLAALIGGAAERLRERIAMRPHPADTRINRAYLERASAQLDPAAYQAAWSEGRALKIEDAVRLALERRLR